MHDGSLSLRRVFVLIRGLPPRETALARALEGAEATAWGPLEYMAAVQVDYLAAANWQRASGKAADYPAPYPRPGDAGGSSRRPLNAEQQARLLALRNSRPDDDEED